MNTSFISQNTTISPAQPHSDLVSRITKKVNHIKQEAVVLLRAARGAMLRLIWRKRPPASRLLLGLLSSFFAIHAHGLELNALPAGGAIQQGSAQIQQTSNQLTVQQHSDKLGINWQSFNIGANASVVFQQPNSQSIALNRVIGNQSSEIYGRLSANGQVFLTNPNGILFAPSAKVDVGGLVASTLDLTQEDFAAGRYRFQGSAGTLQNQGQIAGQGYVALFGGDVNNSGQIDVATGSVVLAAGRAMTVNIDPAGLLSATVTPSLSNTIVSNQGQIRADGGVVRLDARSAGDIAKSMVNNSGVIQARSIENRNGEIWLTGADTIQAGGVLDASADQQGNAGKVMVIADMQHGTTHVTGSLQAQGGKNSGNGGLVETSGAHVNIGETAQINTAANKGDTGTWLIDPTDFNIAASGGDMTGSALGSALSSNNVTISTQNGTSGSNGDVLVNDPVSWSQNKLTLNAHRNININSPMQGSGTAQLALEYGQGAIAEGNTATYNVSAPVDLPAGQNFSTKLGSDGTVKSYTVITELGSEGSKTGTDLQGITGNLTGNYVLGKNIDASATANWNSGAGFLPLANQGYYHWYYNGFSGIFDGLGHTVSDLKIDSSTNISSVGMFGFISQGTIRNLGLLGGSIENTNNQDINQYIGALAGEISNTRIENVYSSLAIKSSHNNSITYIGGLIGMSISSSIEKSHATGNITISQPSTTSSNYFASQYVGGLVGYFAGSSDKGIKDSYATGKISVAIPDSYSSVYAGGLIGAVNGSGTDSDIRNSYATGSVDTASKGSIYAGGLIAQNTSSSSGANVFDSYATGNITATGRYIYAGGLIAYNDGSTTNTQTNVSAATIKNSYATGNITSTSIFNSNQSSSTVYLGGLVGHNSGSNSFYTSQTNNNTTTYPTALSASIHNSYATGNITSNQSIASGASTYTYSYVYAGGLLGYNYGSNYDYNTTHIDSASQAASIHNSYATGSVTDNQKYRAYIGGLVGSNSADGNSNLLNREQAGIFDSHATGTVTSSAQSYVLAGGLVGEQSGTAAKIQQSYASGNVITAYMPNAYADYYSNNVVGGLVGRNNGKIERSFASGYVLGTGMIGGLAGSNGGSISDSYASGLVGGYTYQASPQSTTYTLSYYLGGLVGYNGYSYNTSISNSYATGSIFAAPTTSITTAPTSSVSSSYGGLIGYQDPYYFGKPTLTNNYRTFNAVNDTGYGTLLDATQVKQQASFGNFDFDKTWKIYEGNSTPLLRSFMTPLVVDLGSDINKTYDGLRFTSGTPTATYPVAPDSRLLGTLSLTDNRQSAVHAGKYQVTPTGLYSTQLGYLINYQGGELTIKPKQLTVDMTLNSVAKTYDGLLDATGSSITLNSPVSGLIGSDSMSSFTANDVKLTFSDAHVATPNKTVSVKITGGLTSTGSGLKDGSSAGNEVVSLTSDYILPVATAAGTINPRPITASTAINAVEKEYDGLLQATGSTVSISNINGFVGTDSLQTATSNFDLRYNDAHVATANKTISATYVNPLNSTGSGLKDGSSAGNEVKSALSDYTLPAITSVAGTINPKTVNTYAYIGPWSKVYDGLSNANTSYVSAYNQTNLVGNDSFTFDTSSYILKYDNPHVGYQKITATSGSVALGKLYSDGRGQKDGSSTGNEVVSVLSDYVLGAQPTVYNSYGHITARPITINANISAISKTYDGLTSATGASVDGLSIASGLLTGDSANLDTSNVSLQFDSAHAAYAHKIQAKGLTLSGFNSTGSGAKDGSSAGNEVVSLVTDYAITTPSVAGKILPKPLTVTATVIPADKVYDGTLLAPNASVDPNSYVVTGAINGDQVTLGKLGVTLKFSDAHVATPNKTINASGVYIAYTSFFTGGNGLKDGSSIGNEVRSYDDDYALDYNAVFASAPANITAKPITASASINARPKTYDGTLAANTSNIDITVSGLIGSDKMTLDTTAVNLNYSDAHAATANNTISTTGSLALGTLASTGQGWKDGRSTYDLVVSQLSDYALTAMPTITPVAGVINPINLNVSAEVNVASKVYDGLQAATGSTASNFVVAGWLQGDNGGVDSSNMALKFVDTHAGKNKAITANGLTISNFVSGSAKGNADGSNADNRVAALASDYSVNNVTLTNNGEILPRKLSVTATVTPVDKVYDGLLAATGSSASNYQISGLLNGDTARVDASQTSLKFNDAHVATANKVIQATGATLLGVTGMGNGNKDGSALGHETAGSMSDYEVDHQAIMGSAAGNITARTISATSTIQAAAKDYDGLLAATGSKVISNVTGLVGTDKLSMDDSGIHLNYSDAHAATSNKTISATGNLVMGKLTSIGGGTKDGRSVGNEVVAEISDYQMPTLPTIAPVSGIINPKSVVANVKITPKEKIYDGLLAATGSTVSADVQGLAGDDAMSFDVSNVKLNFSSAHANVSNNQIVASGTTTLGSLVSNGRGLKDGSSVGNEVQSLDSDYIIPSTPTMNSVAGVIKPKVLGLSAQVTGASKTYDGLLAAPGASAANLMLTGGFLSGDSGSLDASGMVLNFASPHVSSQNNTIRVDGLTIANLTSSGEGSKDGTAGNRVVSLASDYQVDPTTTATGTILPKPITANITITPKDKVYDGLLIATGSTMTASVGGLLGSDSMQLDTSDVQLHFSDAHVATPNKTIGLAGGNVKISKLVSTGNGDKDGHAAGHEVISETTDYIVPTSPTVNSVTGNILAKSLTGSASIVAADKTYDGLVTATGSKVHLQTSGLIGNDTLQVDSSNISLNFQSAHASNNNKITATGTLGASTLLSTGAGRKDGSSDGHQVVSQPSDYIMPTISPTLTAAYGVINPKEVVANVTITPKAKVFDGLLSATGSTLSSQLTGLIGTDSMSLDASGVSIRYTDAHVSTPNKLIVGNGTVSLSDLVSTGQGAKDGSSAGNEVPSLKSDYILPTKPQVTSVAGVILPRQLTVTAKINAVPKIYDGLLTATGSSLVDVNVSSAAEGDVVILDTSTAALRFSDAHVATPNNFIQATGLKVSQVQSAGRGAQDGSSIGNEVASQMGDYAVDAGAISNVAGVILPRPLTLQATINPVDKVYDGLLSATGSSLSLGQVTGLVGTDKATADASGIHLSFADAHVATPNNSIGISGSAQINAVTSTGSGAKDGSSLGNEVMSANSDYVIASQSVARVSAKILPRPVSMNAQIQPIAKPYDGTTLAGTSQVIGTASGAVGADRFELDNSEVSLNYSDAHVATPNKTIAATGNVKLGKVISTGAGIKDGSSAGNEVVSENTDYVMPVAPQLAAVSGEITPRVLGSNAAITGTLTKVYDGTTAATGAQVTGEMQNVVSGDEVSLDASQVTLNYNDPNVALANRIIASGNPSFALNRSSNGSLVSDYQFTYTIADVAASITPRPLFVSANNVLRLSNEPNPDKFTYSSNIGGLLNNDSLASANINVPEDSKNAQGGYVGVLKPSAAVFASGDPRNYALNYTDGLLVVLPAPVLGTGSGGNENEQFFLVVEHAQEQENKQVLDKVQSSIVNDVTSSNHPKNNARTNRNDRTNATITPVSTDTAKQLETARNSVQNISVQSLRQQSLLTFDPALTGAKK